MSYLYYDCMTLKSGTNYFDDYYVNKPITNLTQLIVATNKANFEQTRLCTLELEFFRIFQSRNHGNMNITYINIEPTTHFEELLKIHPNIDIFLVQSSLDDYFYRFAISPWIKEENQLVILSALNPLYKSFTKQLLNAFSVQTWFLIIPSVLAVSLITHFQITLKDKINVTTFWERFKSQTNIANVLFMVIVRLLNQEHRTKMRLSVIHIWSLIATVLVSCFSGFILSSILLQPMKTIENFDDLKQSNLSLIIGNWSYIWSSTQYNQTEPKLQYLKNKIYISLTDWDEMNTEIILKIIVNKTAAYVREGVLIDSIVNKYPHYSSSIAIASERYLSNLLGYVINKNYSTVRTKIFKIMKHSIESGVNLKAFDRWNFAEKLEGFRRMSQLNIDIDNFDKCSSNKFDERCTHVIKLDMFSDLFIVSGLGLAVSAFILFAENVINYLRLKNNQINF